jgi:hypothetical protein
MMRFFDHLLAPLFNLWENGIVWQVGRGSEAEIRRFVPFLVDLIGDELIQSERTGCSFQCKHFSCGRCLRKNCFSYYNPPIDDDLRMGSYVTFEYNNQDYQSFIHPYNITSLKVTEDSTTVKNKIFTFTNITNLFILDEHENQWRNLKTFDESRVFVDSKMKNGRNEKSKTYKVLSIRRSRGVRIDTNTMLVIDDINIKNLATLRRPYSGLCNFGLGGTWKHAVVVRESSDLKNVDVLYDDGDMEKNIPKNRFIYFDVSRNDDQMNMLSEGKLAILLRRIEHFRTTGKFKRTFQYYG